MDTGDGVVRKKIFHSYIKKYQVFSKAAIYDKFAKHRISEFNRHEATLYFIVKTPKITIVPSSFKVIENFNIKGKFFIEGQLVDIVFNAAKVQFDDPAIKKRFKTLGEFTNSCMNRWTFPQSKSMSSSVKYANATTINFEKSSANYIHINCALRRVITKSENGELILSSYQLINFININCIRNLDILYIGKSNDDTWKRIYNHNKWGLIEEYRESRDDLLIYFLQIDKNHINFANEHKTTLVQSYESELSIEDATTATESALIIYFISKKLFNIDYVGSDIKKTKIVREVLQPKGYNQIVVELCLDGFFGILGSESITPSDYHMIGYEI